MRSFFRIIIFSSLFVFARICDGIVMDPKESDSMTAILNSVETSKFLEDRKLVLKFPGILKDKTKVAEVEIDLRFDGFGKIYKPIKLVKVVKFNFEMSDVKDKVLQKNLKDLAEKCKTNPFVAFVLKALMFDSFISKESRKQDKESKKQDQILIKFDGKFVRFNIYSLNVLYSYLFVRLAQVNIDEKLFFDVVEDLDSQIKNLPFLLSGNVELLQKLKNFYKLFKGEVPSSDKVGNQFLISDLTEKLKKGEFNQVMQVLIFNTIIAFAENKVKYEDQAKEDSYYEKLKASRTQYAEAKKKLKELSEDATLKMKGKALTLFNKRKEEKARSEVEFNKLFVDKYSYHGKTIIEWLTLAVEKLKNEIKDREQIEQLYSLLAPLYMIGIDTSIFYGMIKGAIGKVAGVFSFIGKAKKVPGKIKSFLGSKIREVKELVTGKAKTMKSDAEGTVKGAKESVKKEKEVLARDVEVAKKEES